MKIERFYSELRRKTGFTLVEVLVSVALMSLIGIYFISAQINTVKERMIESVAQDVLTLANSSVAYFIQTATWPDQVANCADLVDVLVGVDAFPAGAGGYQGPNGATISTDCSNLSTVGSALRITVTFTSGSSDDAELLLGYLPTSLDTTVSGGDPKVTHYVATPRHASDQRYTFHKARLEEDSAFYLDKPDCHGGTTQPAYIVIPQAICISGGNNGLGGYYFRDMGGAGPDQWHLQLRVANGTNNGMPNNFNHLGDNPQCDFRDIWVGAVTYCE